MKVVFDTDPGIDDAMALLYLNACDNLDLLAVTTIVGNASIDQCTLNALFLCEKFGIDVPVYKGAGRGIDGSEPGDFPDFVHGLNGLGDVILAAPRISVESLDAYDYLVNIAKKYPDEITIVAVGRLTNLALAIQSDPDFSGNIKDIIFMGGAYLCEGNVTPWAEANIIGDPEAAAIVFNSGITLTMVGLDVTMQTRMSNDYLAKLAAGLGDLGDFVLNINKVYAGYYQTSQGWDEFPVHDSSAVAWADNSNLFSTVSGKLDCVLTGEKLGQTVFEPHQTGAHKVCVSVDAKALLESYLNTIVGWQKNRTNQ